MIMKFMSKFNADTLTARWRDKIEASYEHKIADSLQKMDLVQLWGTQNKIERLPKTTRTVLVL